jgi:hypothetical protein
MPCVGQTVSHLVQRVSNLLGDQCVGQQYHRWTKGALIDILNDARCSLVSMRPDAFTQAVDLTLAPGSLQTLDKRYESLVDVISSGSGATEASVGTADIYYTKALRGKKCLANSDCTPASSYTMAYASVNEKNPRVFTVSPPVPVGSSPTVKANVVVTPAPYCPADEGKDLDIECQFVPALMEYMLYRAYGMEIDSAASEQASERHFKAYLTLIDKGYLVAQRWGSGYYKGKIGADDPAFKSR